MNDIAIICELVALQGDYWLEKESHLRWPTEDTVSIQSLAAWLATPAVVDWLIERSAKTPYTHIRDYMERYWVFNAYPNEERDRPSGRVHHILRRDLDRHCHDHPWPARTIVLKGWYTELRLSADGTQQQFLREAGDTATLAYGEFHRITEVSPGGVWTLFMTEAYQGTWGFLVAGEKVPYKTYLANLP